MESKRTFFVSAVVLAGVMVCGIGAGAVQAAEVVVLRGSPDWAGSPSHAAGILAFENNITAFYNNRTDWQATAITRSSSNELSAADLTDTRLLIVAVTGREFTTAERSLLGSFVNGGRHIMFVGENANFQFGNNLISTEIGALGGTMGTDGTMVHGADNFTPTTANGQILDHALTQNVHSFAYGSAGIVTGGDTLFTRSSDFAFPYNTAFAAAEQIGNGWVTFLADTNVVPSISPGIPIGDDLYNNDVFFYNAAAIVPAPASLALLGLGCLPVMRRRRA